MNKRYFTVKQKYHSAFTLIELLVVISIVSLLISILLPALASARKSARNVLCLTNLRQLGVLNTSYLADFKQTFAARDINIAAKMSTVFTAQREVLRHTRPTLKVLECPEDEENARLYQTGIETNVNTLGIGTMYGVSTVSKQRISYGFNAHISQTGDNKPRINNPRIDAYYKPSLAILQADSSYIGFNRNTPASMKRITSSDYSTNYPDSVSSVLYDDKTLARHLGSNNVLFMDMHAGTETQQRVYSDYFMRVFETE